jgi:hypothetical protein
MNRDIQRERAFTGPSDPFYYLFCVQPGNVQTQPCQHCGRKLLVLENGVTVNCCCSRLAFLATHRDGETFEQFTARMDDEWPRPMSVRR